MKMQYRLVLFVSGLLFCSSINAQNSSALWHGKERELRYRPDGEDIVITNGSKRFNRALYGGNTAFRAEAGDLPEFALYMPGMGGNLKFGLIKGNVSKWLITANNITARYRPGSMLYEVGDSLLGGGTLTVTALPLYTGEGLIVKVTAANLPAGLQLLCAFGGATGTKFSRDGDIGADPESSFYLKPEYCRDNVFTLAKNEFSLHYGSKKPLTEEQRYEIQHTTPVTGDSSKPTAPLKKLDGIFPPSAALKLSDAAQQITPLAFYASPASATPALTAVMPLKSNNDLYFFINNASAAGSTYQQLPQLFNTAEAARKALAGRIKVVTPDPYINTLGGALSVAADAIWEDPSYMHGAVAWRMRLPAWRGPYAADVLGWHDRAKRHFSSYALSQVLTPLGGPVTPDTALHGARQLEKMGTAVFSNGYIARNPGGDIRPHHYDMNLVFVDQLLNHFNWTGDTAYVRQMWPLLERHLAWEKRNFDADGDGLYDAYAAIWASDALQYSGGGVTHSSAYNYRANKTAAALAILIGKDGSAYAQEAEKILKAMNEKLWMPAAGSYAEYKDLLGGQLLHPAAGLWTIYHAIDSKVPDAFQSWQMLDYVDHSIPHIPIRVKGLADTSMYLLSTSNWQPYTWSINNVALAENLNMALAYWQGGRAEEAYRLWKSALTESMYLGSSPGNFEQLSPYDAIRGELYRDFGDGIGVAARSLVEGLFGIEPDALHDKLTITPGFPENWDHASLTTPDIKFSYRQKGKKDTYIITPSFANSSTLQLVLQGKANYIKEVKVNGKKVVWWILDSSVGKPALLLDCGRSKNYTIEITWQGNLDTLSKFDEIGSIYDPLTKAINTTPSGTEQKNLHFIRLQQGAFNYWKPVWPAQSTDQLSGMKTPSVKSSDLPQYQKVNLDAYFNDDVANIFKNQYFSPRPAAPTLQLPTQGIGNWCYPLTEAVINDEGLRKRAGAANEIVTAGGIPFSTPAAKGAKNILFTSLWDKYPDSLSIPLSGKASQACLLMAGSTNPMQSRLTNGRIIIQYKDGSKDSLDLKNPENWWPIEQDYYIDGFAFTTDAPPPVRISLKTGEEIRKDYHYTTIKGFTNMGIDGGAATVLNLPLNPAKELAMLTVKAVANDVVIGLMSLTLAR